MNQNPLEASKEASPPFPLKPEGDSTECNEQISINTHSEEDLAVFFAQEPCNLCYAETEDPFQELAEEPYDSTGYRCIVKHNKHRRALCHDYSAPAFYMITLVVADRHSLFGDITQEFPVRMVYSRLGQLILDNEVKKINQYYPNVQVLKIALMPDHLHMIVRVAESFEEGKHLGYVVRGFKTGCTRAWWSLSGVTPGRLPILFEEGYNDRILFENSRLDRWCNYLDDNPRRLYFKKKFPNLFQVKHSINIHGMACEMVGNGYLLNIPDKMAVIVHRADSDDCYERKMREWMACGERGGVLVGAFISPREKRIRRMAEERGYNIIEIRENGFPKLYKPYGAAFDACTAGTLLQVSPWPYHFEKRPLTRRECQAMNILAERIERGF